MADLTLGDVFDAVVKSTGELVPTTDPHETFNMIEFVITDENGIPSNVKDRAVWIRSAALEFEKDSAGVSIRWGIDMMFSLWHDTRKKRNNRFERIRIQDMALIIENMIRNAPGRANGLDLWMLTQPPNEPDYDAPFARTDFVLHGTPKVSALF